jgi:4-alpha-glucanotransferase
MKNRGSGILLHVTSLPSPYGIGDFGPWAYRFADFLAQGKQSYWQVLPLNPTDPVSGNSPYSSPSAFAGNILLISPDLLEESGFLTKEDLEAHPSFPEARCDYTSVISYKAQLFHRAYQRFKATGNDKELYDKFCQKNKAWLEDFALYAVIKKDRNGKAWGEWEKGLRDRNPKEIDRMKKEFHDELEREKFLQYLFFKQWLSLKKYCNDKGIRLIGDIPIYVNYDSVDVWTHPELFKLDKDKTPTFVAGVPPDYFSKTGQLWGNPIYRWDMLKKTGYRWWFQRIGHNLLLFDTLRLDHFRGFVGFWEVPSTEGTAIHGKWVKAPAVDFFTALLKKFPTHSIIAEDLGVITPDVKEVVNRFGFPGMRILQFAFGEDLPTHPYLPHNYMPNTLVYTGTHDNNTIRGWFENEATPEDKKRLFRYFGREILPEECPKELHRLAMMSVANTVIIPVQDLLGLGEEAKMNRPSVAHGNWEWRFLPDQLNFSCAESLREMTTIYGRAPEDRSDETS